jgi:hypothetical protein
VVHTWWSFFWTLVEVFARDVYIRWLKGHHCWRKLCREHTQCNIMRKQEITHKKNHWKHTWFKKMTSTHIIETLSYSIMKNEQYVQWVKTIPQIMASGHTSQNTELGAEWKCSASEKLTCGYRAFAIFGILACWSAPPRVTKTFEGGRSKAHSYGTNLSISLKLGEWYYIEWVLSSAYFKTLRFWFVMYNVSADILDLKPDPLTKSLIR